jgi:hypothetical protein
MIHMKRYLKYLSVIILAVTTSCEKYLDIPPETSITQETFFKNQQDFEQAVNGIYAPLQPIYNNAWQLSELRSDNGYFIYNTANRGGKATEDLATFTVETNNLTLQNFWQDNYLIISRANLVLSQIDAVEFDQAAKSKLKGQSQFLRALAYFNLVKNFGGVPLFTKPADSYENAFKNRATAEDVYKQIVDDLKSAITLLPNRSVERSVGRATSGAAYTLLADVYMTQKLWSDAEAALRPVLTMQYTLLPAYADIFKPSNKANAELIFQVNYVEATAQPQFSTFPYSFLPNLANIALITGVTPATTAGGGFNTPTPELLQSYEDIVLDTRYNATIGTYTGPSPLPGVTYNNTPYVKKYLHPHQIPGQTNVNWPVYRYAEVLLMLSECLNEQNKQAEALTHLNAVRQRAGLPAFTNSAQAALRTALLRERRVELAFENKRWSDLIRSGTAVTVMTAFGASVKANPGRYYYASGVAPLPNSFSITNNSLLYPIPVTEIIINPGLIQNPGY